MTFSLQTGDLAANECDKLDTSENSSVEKKPPPRLVHQRSADAIEEENEDDIKCSEQNKNCVYENGQEDVNNGCDKSNGVSNGPVNSNAKKDDFNKLPPSGGGSATFKVPVLENNLYTWRIDLSKTEPFWNGWFKGLSQKFLDIPVPKVLLLANIHGLDTTLTVGQMQGKFQLQVLPRSGHAIHEDQPHHVADIIAGFLVKQRLALSRNGFTPTMPAC